MLLQEGIELSTNEGKGTQGDLLRKTLCIKDRLIMDGLYDGYRVDGQGDAIPRQWRVGATPFAISAQERSFFTSLGPILHSFVRACHALYFRSIAGSQPSWVADILDLGKSPDLVAYGRMHRLRSHLPLVIRPDIIPTANGFKITELDSVPGGIGLTGALLRAYHEAGWDVIGHENGNDMVRGFAAMMHELERPKETSDALTPAIVVSDESADYRPEMAWLALQLTKLGLHTYAVNPRQVHFTEEGLRIRIGDRDIPISVLYRFFELYDMKNVPKSELIAYSAKKGRVSVTPPLKAFLEEKAWFAFFHHPSLRPFWIQELGDEAFGTLQALIPRTWVLDSRDVPPHAVIPNLTIAERPVETWDQLKTVTQKERRFAIKPSGFSPLAWGGRGISIGHDLPQREWREALNHAVSSFFTTPYVLQEFHQGRKFTLPSIDDAGEEIQPITGRARLSPYYFVCGDDVRLGGILATVCGLEKKLIHGMKDAVIIPCAVEGHP